MNPNAQPIRLPSAGPLNLPTGVVRPNEPTPLLRNDREGNVRARMVAEDLGLQQQLADLRVDLVALRNLLEVGLDLLANDVPLKDVAQFLTSTGAFNADTGCRCDLHRKAA